MSHEHWGPSGFGVVWEGGHDQEGAEDSILMLALEWPLECPIVAVGDASCGLWARRAGLEGQVSLTAPPHLEADRGLWSMGGGRGGVAASPGDAHVAGESGRAGAEHGLEGTPGGVLRWLWSQGDSHSPSVSPQLWIGWHVGAGASALPRFLLGAAQVGTGEV